MRPLVNPFTKATCCGSDRLGHFFKGWGGVRAVAAAHLSPGRVSLIDVALMTNNNALILPAAPALCPDYRCFKRITVVLAMCARFDSIIVNMHVTSDNMPKHTAKA